MIEEEQDSIFKLEDAVIFYFPDLDSMYMANWSSGPNSIRADTIYINKAIELNNVQFSIYPKGGTRSRDVGIVSYMVFNKRVYLQNSFGIIFQNCVFKEWVGIYLDESLTDNLVQLRQEYGRSSFWFLQIEHCEFKKGLSYSHNTDSNPLLLAFSIKNSKIYNSSNNSGERILLIQSNSTPYIEIENNRVIGNGWNFLFLDCEDELLINGNDFGDSKVYLKGPNEESTYISLRENIINSDILLDFPSIGSNATIEWNQLAGKIIHNETFDHVFRGNMEKYNLDTIQKLNTGHMRSQEKNRLLHRPAKN
jgi:hypothetical protein